MSAFDRREDQIVFILNLLERFPEGQLLFGPAKSSPEALPQLSERSITRDICQRINVTLDETAVEADRTFSGVILFRAVLADDKSYFPSLSEESFNKLKALTSKFTNEKEKYIDLVFYSLLCNDLGKVDSLCSLYKELMGEEEKDHDSCLYYLVKHRQDLFPGFSNFDEELQTLYLEGLEMMAEFNLAQLVQGENLPSNLLIPSHITSFAKELRLLEEIYDFAGVTGNVTMDKSIVLSNDTARFYHAAIDAVLTAADNGPRSIYDGYLLKRLAETDFFDASSGERRVTVQMKKAQSAEQLAQRTVRVYGRLLCLSREVSTIRYIEEALHGLDEDTREVIIEELSADGLDDVGILIYYFPAVIANALGKLKAEVDAMTELDETQKQTMLTNNKVIALKKSLEEVTVYYRDTRASLVTSSTINKGTVTVNVLSLANRMKTIQYY